jgi:glycosyltransferase involved in cell wall biosynthesis
LLGSARTLRPDAHLLVLSGSPDEARAALLASNASLSASVTVIRAAPADVPRYLAAADLGTAYRVPSFSMRGVAPIKLSEYLLCGLPIAGTAAVGDTGRIIDAGLFCDDRLGPAATASWLMDDVLPQRASYRTRARELGRSVFSLDQSIASYLAALRHCSAHMSRDQTNMPR